MYALSLGGQEADETPGIEIVRQVFDDRLDIVEKHWSGDLNAPENRGFDEGVSRRSLHLVEWDTYPTYDRGTVRFQGTLLRDAVLQQTKRETQENGWTPYTLTVADGYDFVGNILPKFEDGREWILDDDTGSAVATEYFFYPSTNQFKVSFPFPKALSGPHRICLARSGIRGRQPEAARWRGRGHIRLRENPGGVAIRRRVSHFSPAPLPGARAARGNKIEAAPGFRLLLGCGLWCQRNPVL